MFNFPCFFKEFFPAQFTAVGASIFKFTFNNILCCDSGMIGTGNPECRFSLHAVVANNDILQAVI
jgi:hypothetical protein